MNNKLEAYYLKTMLLNIYPCKKDFELQVIDKRPKTLEGCYIPLTCRIRIYTKGRNWTSIKEIAIHEYAHHIHETEKRINPNRRNKNVHGPEFWRIYSTLCYKATKMGIYTDPLIVDMI